MCVWRLRLPLLTLPSLSSNRNFRSEWYLQARCGGTGHKLNSPKRVCMGCRCLLPTQTWELEPSYTLIEEGLWKTLYSTQIHVHSGPKLTHAIPQPLPAPKIRMLASMSTLRQGAGGFCPDFSSQREACLEASSRLAAFLWQ